MNDEVLLRMLQDASANLEGVKFPTDTSNVAPIYNALLAMLKVNHPGHPYLEALPPIEGGAGPEELRLLFGQLRVLLETLIAPAGADGSVLTQRLAASQ